MKRRAGLLFQTARRHTSWVVSYERGLRQWGLVGGAGDVENLEGLTEGLAAEVGGFRLADRPHRPTTAASGCCGGSSPPPPSVHTLRGNRPSVLSAPADLCR